ncbi:Protein of unknown function [Meinhardsimonia xiamenensis]|jgi:tetratricopeptide (TPR) repeat protein|uniref:ATP-dependent transcriptional regulator n=1 Tax=Meinhardsimonia xiamenensis TaxID=990712 RepID=A0A1G9BCK9_9RHOB|nr:DUF2927 domain-containing protein [Meinhardsimonia xiamenensis]PRX35027.1 Protein of unknown function (DUF2927) [Meinhardsimonia xiamenensis]SDK37296.1 Protein of unknown function [Meinhardsimonia xiamenensis]
MPAAALSLLVSCAAAPPDGLASRVARTPTDPLPPMKFFGSEARSLPPLRSNAEMAQDFLDLSFRLESGRELEVMSRFEGPISLRLVGAEAVPSLGPDLARLLSRLRREAGISIARVPADDASASITVEVLPRRLLRRHAPSAACFVVPRVSSWEEFVRNRNSERIDWATLRVRERLAIFLPGDVSPQEARDCLHEELAQALGPLNDLYRLPDSVFNDDNFHTVLTGFDMLMLRAYYDPALASGMTRDEAARRIRSILARLNPQGERVPARPVRPTPPEWTRAMEEALGQRSPQARREAAARRAVQIAEAAGIDDTRLGFSLYALGRLSLARSAETALAAFLNARQIYASRPETAVQAAHVSMQIAAFSLSAGQTDTALELVEEALPAAAQAENAALLATLLMIKAEALEQLGRSREARAVRLDSLGWARYGFGSDSDVRARVAEIAALAPQVGRALRR